MPQLATSTKQAQSVSLPFQGGRTQFRRLSNQRTNRYLSKAAVQPDITPILRQQVFEPSEALQQRFTQERASLDTKRQQINSFEQEQVLRQHMQTLRQKSEVLESKISEVEKSVAKAAPSVQIFTKKQEALTQLRKKIQEHENTLGDLSERLGFIQEQEEGLVHEKKANEALVQNLKNAQSNLHKQLNEELVKKDSQAVVTNIKDQLRTVTRRLSQLQQQTTQLDKKQQEITTKKRQQQELSEKLALLKKQLGELEVSSTPESELEVSNTLEKLSVQEEAQQKTLINLQEQLQQLHSQRKQVADISQQLIGKLQDLSKQESLHKVDLGNIPTITKTPNAINGIVVNTENRLVSEAIIIIKDTNNRPLRALKTNELGQFWIASPLPNGEYILEPEATELRFDTIHVNLSGKIVDPIVIKAL